MKITENSQSQFINYCLDFYGQAGIYPLADPIINNKFVERDDVLKANFILWKWEFFYLHLLFSHVI